MGMNYIQFVLKREPTGDRHKISFSTVGKEEMIWSFIAAIEKKTNGYYSVKIAKPHRPRSDGQRKCFNGWIQFFCNETGNDFHQVKMYLKKKAISRGYPFQTDDAGRTMYDIYGDVMPQSEALATVDQEKLLIEEMQQLADEYNIRLPERSMFE